MKSRYLFCNGLMFKCLYFGRFFSIICDIATNSKLFTNFATLIKTYKIILNEKKYIFHTVFVYNLV